MNENQTEHKIMALLLNEPSREFEFENYVFVFKRPTLVEKHKSESWYLKKAREIGFDITDEQDMLSTYYNLFKVLNSYVLSVRFEGKEIPLTSPYAFESALNHFYTMTGRDTDFLYKVLDFYTEWQKETALTAEEQDQAKKS